MTEDQILADCIQWAWNYMPETRRLIWHVANERAASKIEGAQLKAKGVVPGALDVVFFWRNRPYIFEFKSDVGQLSKDQKKVIEALRLQGVSIVVIRNKEEWIKQIKTIVDGK